jgi:hypothetical protein
MNYKQKLALLDTKTSTFNFAFCPNQPLSCGKNLASSLIEEIKNGKNLKNITNEECNKIVSASNFFYICYSFKINEENYNGLEYFFFQTFYRVGRSDLIYSKPVFGFFSRQEIIDFINSISDLFAPSNHDKQIFDAVEVGFESTSELILKLMTTWTILKINEFDKNSIRQTGDNILFDEVEKILSKIRFKKTIKKTTKNGTKKRKPRANSTKNKLVDKPKRKKPAIKKAKSR